MKLQDMFNRVFGKKQPTPNLRLAKKAKGEPKPATYGQYRRRFILPSGRRVTRHEVRCINLCRVLVVRAKVHKCSRFRTVQDGLYACRVCGKQVAA